MSTTSSQSRSVHSESPEQLAVTLPAGLNAARRMPHRARKEAKKPLWALSRHEAETYWELLQLDKQIQRLRNQSEFYELLATFWPLENMTQRMESCNRQMEALYDQRVAVATRLVARST